MPPLKLDTQPRYVEPVIPSDLGEGVLYHALRELRALAQARGYNSRPIEFSDCVLVCSEMSALTAAHLKEKFKGLRVQLVTPSVLKTPLAWALMFGKDAFVSAPAW